MKMKPVYQLICKLGLWWKWS